MKNTKFYCVGTAILMVVALQGPVLAAGDSIFLFDRSGNNDRTDPSVITDVEQDGTATTAKEQRTSDKHSAPAAPAGNRSGHPVQRVQGQSSSEVPEPAEEKVEQAVDPHQP